MFRRKESISDDIQSTGIMYDNTFCDYAAVLD